MNKGFYEFSRPHPTSSVFPYTGSAIISGSLNVTGSVVATSFTGSLFGTATQAISASYSNNSTSASYSLSSSFTISSSRAESSSFATTSSFAISASWAPTQNIDTSSLVTTASFNAFTSSYNTGSFTGSFTGSLFGTSSWATNSLTASYTTSSNVYGPFGADSVTSSSYAGTASVLLGSIESASYALTASYALNGGGASTPTFPYTGSAIISGSLLVTGSLRVSGSITGSLFGTSSWAVSASWAPAAASATASFVTASDVYGPFGSNSITSASFAATASYALQAVSASFAQTASYSKNLQISGSINNVDYVDFNTSASVTQPIPGRLSWNDTDGTLDIGLKGGNVTLQIGQEEVARVVNKTGGNLLEADYHVVRIRSVAEGGAQGQRLAVVLAQANNDANSATTLGLVTEDITVNQEGFITLSGQVRGINTTGTLQGETWTDGDVLYLSPTTPGYLTNIKPQAPQHTVIVGYVEYAHNNQGKIFVKVDNGYEIDELHNVRIDTGSLTPGQLLVRSGSVWVNSNQLTGSYGLTGSLQATSFSGSLFGTSSFAVSSSFSTTASYALNGGVTQIVAGTNVTISPTNGLGAVTINSTGGGGSGGTDLGLVQAMTVGLQNIF